MQGILKADWMHKQTNLYPSVVVFFVEWDVKLWHTREIEFTYKIESFKYVHQSLKLPSQSTLTFLFTHSRQQNNRGVKLLIVFVYKGTPPSLSDERIVMLRRKTELSERSLLTFCEDDINTATTK